LKIYYRNILFYLGIEREVVKMTLRNFFLGCFAAMVLFFSENLVLVGNTYAQASKGNPILSNYGIRPKWTDMETYWTNRGSIFCTGTCFGGADYSLSARIAKSEAIKNLIESVSIKARSEFSHSIHGNNMSPEDIGRYVTDSVGWVVENLQVSGIKMVGLYHEQAEDFTTGRPLYNVWVLLEIDRDDYIRAKTCAAERLIEKANVENNAEARAKAEALLKNLEKET
jgi:hypothetical protein